jgi:hypothetical protein
MARPGRPERNRANRSFRQLRRFHHDINSNKVFGTHNARVDADTGEEVPNEDIVKFACQIFPRQIVGVMRPILVMLMHAIERAR